MNPALSVLLLTTLIGAGQGLFIALVSVQTQALLGLQPQPPSTQFYVAGSALALACLAAGLLASFFHLGRPERAWRTATMWRTSWLAREVIVLPAFMASVALYGALHYFSAAPLPAPGSASAVESSLAVGVLGSLLAFALFVCTAMIYACLRFLAEWHTPLTLVNFTLLGMASGFTLATALAAFCTPQHLRFLAGWAIALTLLGAVSRALSLRRNARLRPLSSVQSAIGIKHPIVVQKSRGFVGSSFNTREFFHGRGVAALRHVKWGFLVTAFAVPPVCLWLGQHNASGALLGAAFVIQYLGLLAERWFFFAQARHPQNLYYQAVS
jgi:DMSO reductase anchor subunit